MQNFLIKFSITVSNMNSTESKKGEFYKMSWVLLVVCSQNGSSILFFVCFILKVCKYVLS